MLAQILRWFPGWVRVEAEGGYPERLLNDLVSAGIPLWHVRRREEWIRFSCPAGDYRGMRPYARRACVRMRMRHKHGLPFWRHRYRHRKGLAVGVCVYGLILALLSPRIWVIEVVGNEKTPTEAILAVAETRGVELGGRMTELDIKGLQIRGPDELDTLAWMTVNPSGCVARIEVTEREPTPEIIDLSSPSDLVAARDGLVLRVEVRSGKRLVMDGEAVTAGTVLITGRVESEWGETLYRAYGEVWAETQRRITVSVPLTYTQSVPVGEPVCQPTFSFLCWDFPLYSTTPLQGEYRHSQARHYLTVGQRELPLGITNEFYQPMREQRFTRTEEQAIQEAEKQLAQQEAALFLPDSYEKQTQSGRIKDGQYVLTATYLCRENIAVEVPLEGTVTDTE